MWAWLCSKCGAAAAPEWELPRPPACRLSLPIKTDGRGFVDWLYLDEDFRITRGNKGSVFVHTREEEAEEEE